VILIDYVGVYGMGMGMYMQELMISLDAGNKTPHYVARITLLREDTLANRA
jgi:hypothetical protein